MLKARRGDGYATRSPHGDGFPDHEAPVHISFSSGKRKRVDVEGNYPVSFGYFGSYSVDGLGMALHCLYTTDDFNTGLTKAVNFRGDVDSTGSIFGQMAGAYYGYGAVNQHLITTLNAKDDGRFAFFGALLRQAGENAYEIFDQ